MRKINLILLLTTFLLVLCSSACSSSRASRPADPATALEVDASKALMQLYRNEVSAKILGRNAKAVLVFPSITKAGLMLGGQYGKGVLFRKGKVEGFYRTTAASYGFQAGIQKYGYALFFMEDSDLAYLKNSEGWELGVGPSLTVVDTGIASSITTTTTRSGVFAYFFEQKGLMAGLGIQGTKITPFNPS